MKKYTLLLVLFICTHCLYSQNTGAKKPFEREDVLSSFAIKTKTDLGMYTGRINIGIPLLTYKDQTFEFPMTLNYSSGGYKTNAILGYTGLGWNLTCGGSITRVVNGIPDEENTAYGFGGFYQIHKHSKTKDYKTLFKEGGVLSDKDSHVSLGKWYDYYWLDKFGGAIETTPDLFIFDFMGHSGCFYMGIDTIYVFNTKEPVGEYKININYVATSGPFQRLSIDITTGDGYLYKFKTIPMGNNQSGFHQTSAIFSPFTDPTRHSTWQLYEVIPPRGGPRILINYADVDEAYGCVQPYLTDAFDWDEADFVGSLRPIPDILKKHEGGGSLARSGGASGLFTENVKWGVCNRLFYFRAIKEVRIGDTSINFSYEDRIEERLNSTTMYYYNGVPVKAKLMSRLKKIDVIYANESVKSFSFKYGYSNLIGSWRVRRPVFFLKELVTSEGDIYRMDYYDEDRTFPPYEYSIDHWGYYNNGGTAYPLPFTFVDSNNIERPIGNENERSHASEFSGARLGMLKTLFYPTGGHTKYYYENHTCTHKVTKDLTHDNKQYLRFDPDDNIGGVRIKRIADYSSLLDSTYRDYVYGRYDDYEGCTLSSGILLHTPRYSREKSKFFKRMADKDYTMHGNFTHTKDETHIGYSFVYEYFPDRSFIMHKYSDYNLVPDMPHDPTLYKLGIGNTSKNEKKDNFNSSYDSRYKDRGKLIGKYYFSSDEKLLREEEYIYDFKKNLNKFSTVNTAFTYYYLQNEFIETSPLVKKFDIEYIKGNNSEKVVKVEEYAYNKLGQLINKEVAIDNDKRIYEQQQFIYDIPLNKRNSTTRQMAALDIMRYPIRKQVKISNVGVISGNYFRYNIDGFSAKVDQMQSIKTAKPLPVKDFEFDSYLEIDEDLTIDGYGNIIQSRNRNNVYTTYIWNKNNLLAEIRGVSYTQLKNIIPPSLLNGLNNVLIPSDADLDALDNLRSNDKMRYYQISTYRYIPFVGMVTATDPSGNTTYYEYDPLGRLIKIYIDDENKTKQLIEEYNYNYNYDYISNKSDPR